MPKTRSELKQKNPEITIPFYLESINNTLEKDQCLALINAVEMGEFDNANTAVFELLLETFVNVAIQYPICQESIFNILETFYDTETEPERNIMLILAIGKLGRKGRNTQTTAIALLDKIMSSNPTKDLIKSVILALRDIGLGRGSRKQIFSPLVRLIKEGDQEMRVLAIRALATQLEGYWEYPVQLLKNIVVSDANFRVRYTALTILGDASLMTSRSLGEAIRELAVDLEGQVQSIKDEVFEEKQNGKNVFYLQNQLYSSREILKSLRSYIQKMRF